MDNKPLRWEKFKHFILCNLGKHCDHGHMVHVGDGHFYVVCAYCGKRIAYSHHYSEYKE